MITVSFEKDNALTIKVNDEDVEHYVEDGEYYILDKIYQIRKITILENGVKFKYDGAWV